MTADRASDSESRAARRCPGRGVLRSSDPGARDGADLPLASWQYAGHLGELQGPGSYFASATGPVPVVITLDGDGDIARLPQRLPPPRAPIVATRRHAQQGHAPVPVPRVDIWARRLPAGSSPRRAMIQRLRRRPAGGSLRRVGRHLGSVRVRQPRSSAPSLCPAALGDLPEVVAEHGLDVDSLRFNQRAHYEVRANWKIAIENYLECYHCPVSHPTLSRWWMSAGWSSRPPACGPASSRRRTPARSRVAVRSTPSGELEICPVPSVVSEHEVQRLSRSAEPFPIGPLWPTDAVTSAGYLDYFFADTTDQKWIDDLYELDNQVGAEDTSPSSRRAQRRARSGSSNGAGCSGAPRH